MYSPILAYLMEGARLHVNIRESLWTQGWRTEAEGTAKLENLVLRTGEKQ